MNEAAEATRQGVESVDPASQAEGKQVTTWAARVDEARTFDENARKQYAIDRAYLRGDNRGWDVAVPLIGCYSDTAVSFLYAKDPEVDVLLSERVDPPKEMPPPKPPKPEADPTLGIVLPAVALEAEKANEEYVAQLQPYLGVMEERRKKKEDMRAFSRTLEIVISRMWKLAKMKRRAKRMVRSALGISIGWLKITWQERTAADPVTAQSIQDLQGQLATIQATMKEAQEPGCDAEQLHLKVMDQMKALQARAEKVVARGLAIDFVAAEDITVSTEVDSVLEYVDSGWIDQRVFLKKEDAKARFKSVTEEEWAKATQFSRIKPPDAFVKDAPVVSDDLTEGLSADKADQYRSGGEGADCVCVHETWDKESGVIRVRVDGINRWVVPPAPPQFPTTRFYPFFALAFIEVDGERHPQSKTFRSYKLQNEYNSTRSAFRVHRQRSLPGVIFDKGQIPPDSITAITSSTQQEFTGIVTTDPTIPIANSFTQKPYAPIDPFLYDTAPIRADMETVWGIQEALQGTIQTAKTATEAEIQQSGTGSRVGGDRDTLDDVFTEAAQYTAELLIQALDAKTVREMVGEGAFWPEGLTIEDLDQLCVVQIRAGSSGRPNTSQQREAWAATAPVLQGIAMQVGQMRGASPEEMADTLEAFAEETINRSGDRIDKERFIPQGNDALLAPMPVQVGPAQVSGDPAAMSQPAAAMQPQPEGVM